MRKDAPILSCFHIGLNPSRTVEGHTQHILHDVTLELERGSWSEFVGPSGAGKSLLFGILSLRLEPDAGKLLVDGRNFHRLSRRGVSDLRRVFASASEEPVFLERRTVIENLVLPFVVRGESTSAVERCEALLEEARLLHLRDLQAASLSRQERVAVAVLRAVAGKPKMVLIDDALHQVDDALRGTLLRMIQRVHLDGAAVALFGREPSANARRGKVFTLVGGEIETVVDHASSQPRTPEAGVRT